MSTLDLEQAAALAKCHPDTLRRLMKSGEAPGTKIGRRWITTRRLLQEWIDGVHRRPQSPEETSSALARAVERIANWLPPRIERPQEPPKPLADSAAYSRKRKRAIRQATPPWANRHAIALYYARARALTRSTGIRHSVDHVVPLMGAMVSGLHVEANLQVIPAHLNSQKHNKF